MFVVFRPGKRPATEKRNLTETPSPVPPLEITGPWEVRFPPDRGAPKKVVFNRLMDWSKHADAGIRYFSGTAAYATTFKMPPERLGQARRLYLDLGNVQVIARAKLNGQELGILWKMPYRVEITDSVKAGDNALEIEVTNLWPNRLIGDDRLPADCDWRPDGGLKRWPAWLFEGKPSPTGRFTFTTWRHWTKDSPLVESGLLGPVQITVRGTRAKPARFAPPNVSEPPSAGSRGRTGSPMVTCVPRPGSLCELICPPCPSTIRGDVRDTGANRKQGCGGGLRSLAIWAIVIA